MTWTNELQTNGMFLRHLQTLYVWKLHVKKGVLNFRWIQNKLYSETYLQPPQKCKSTPFRTQVPILAIIYKVLVTAEMRDVNI